MSDGARLGRAAARESGEGGEPYLVDGVGVGLAVRLVGPTVDTTDVDELTTSTKTTGLTHLADYDDEKKQGGGQGSKERGARGVSFPESKSGPFAERWN